MVGVQALFPEEVVNGVVSRSLRLLLSIHSSVEKYLSVHLVAGRLSFSCSERCVFSYCHDEFSYAGHKKADEQQQLPDESCE